MGINKALLKDTPGKVSPPIHVFEWIDDLIPKSIKSVESTVIVGINSAYFTGD